LRKSEKYQVKLTLTEAFTSTFKALVGIGIMSAPAAYKEVGLLGGIIGTILLLLVCNYLYRQLCSVLEVTVSISC
jgi:amino acid permease